MPMCFLVFVFLIFIHLCGTLVGQSKCFSPSLKHTHIHTIHAHVCVGGSNYSGRASMFDWIIWAEISMGSVLVVLYVCLETKRSIKRILY